MIYDNSCIKENAPKQISRNENTNKHGQNQHINQNPANQAMMKSHLNLKMLLKSWKIMRKLTCFHGKLPILMTEGIQKITNTMCEHLRLKGIRMPTETHFINHG